MNINTLGLKTQERRPSTPNQVDATSIFDEGVNRKNTNSMKWDYGHNFLTSEELLADPLPMWVADMDFKAPQPVIDALHDAVEHGVFGYAGGARASYVAAVIDWQKRRFGWDASSDWLMQTSGVITTMKTAIQAFSSPGDSILIQPPVYVEYGVYT
jgi:cystathionine beta-lyase